MGAQPVAEEQHPARLVAGGWEHVQVHLRYAVPGDAVAGEVRRPPLEEPVLVPVRLAYVERVAGCLERRCVAVLVRGVRHGQQEVEQGLGGEPRHRRRADVLDLDVETGERGTDPGRLRGSELGPRGVRLVEDHSLHLLARNQELRSGIGHGYTMAEGERARTRPKVWQVDPSHPVLAFLAAAALLAGFVDAVVGGGGLVQLPALVLGLPGAAPVQILATNKLASVCGTTVSSVTYYRRVRPHAGTFVPLMVFAFAGSLLGAVLASHLPAAAFTPVVLVVLVLVGGFVLLRPGIGERTELRFSGHRHTAAAMATGFVIGVYDGALGPGTGSFFVFTLVGLLGFSFLEASAKARMANWATNIAALCIFVPQDAVAVAHRAGDGAGEPRGRLPRGADRRGEGGQVREGVLPRRRLRVHRPARR